MKKSPGHLLLALAGIDVPGSELYGFFRWVVRNGPDKATDAILDLRRTAAQAESISGGRTVLNRPGSILPSDGRLSTNVARRVQELLLLETGLSKNQAIELIIREIRRRNVSAKDIPSPKKIRMTVWLERVARKFGPNQLLEIASSIRNELMHTSRVHWPLRRETS